jgi:hypothetical protein
MKAAHPIAGKCGFKLANGRSLMKNDVAVTNKRNYM